MLNLGRPAKGAFDLTGAPVEFQVPRMTYVDLCPIEYDSSLGSWADVLSPPLKFTEFRGDFCPASNVVWIPATERDFEFSREFNPAISLYDTLETPGNYLNYGEPTQTPAYYESMAYATQVGPYAVSGAYLGELQGAYGKLSGLEAS